MTTFLLVCAGGALGSGVRYLVLLLTPRILGTAAPWGTLLVNLTGSFAMAFAMEMMTRPAAPSPEARLFVTTGILGGFTTYSAFNFETTTLLRSGATGAAVLNIVATLAGCLVAGVLGVAAAKILR